MEAINNTIGNERVTKTLTGTEYTVGLMIYDIPIGLQGWVKTTYVLENIGYAYGDSHPANENARLSRIDVRALTHDTAEAELTYFETFSLMQISISSVPYQTETNKYYINPKSPTNEEQALIQIAYKYPDDYELDTNLQGKVIQKSPTLQKEMFDTLMTIQREEAITYLDIINRKETYQNKLNLYGWTLDMTAADGYWKCLDITGDKNPSGTYNMTYAFARRKTHYFGSLEFRNQWDIDAYYRDERTGEPPADIVAYNDLDYNGIPDNPPGGLKLGIPIHKYIQFNGLISV